MMYRAMRNELEKAAAEIDLVAPNFMDRGKLLKYYQEQYKDAPAGAKIRVYVDGVRPKTASVSEDLPWYTTAAGATGGILAAQKFLPKKYKAIGQIGGALLGTAGGLKAGKLIGERMKKPKPPKRPPEEPDMSIQPVPGPPRPGMKMAAVEDKPDHPAKTLAKGVLGFGAGMGAGYLGMQAAKKLSGDKLRGSKLMWAVPVATGAGGLIYSQMQNQMLDKMRRDHIKRQEAKRGSKSS